VSLLRKLWVLLKTASLALVLSLALFSLLAQVKGLSILAIPKETRAFLIPKKIKEPAHTKPSPPKLVPVSQVADTHVKLRAPKKETPVAFKAQQKQARKKTRPPRLSPNKKMKPPSAAIIPTESVHLLAPEKSALQPTLPVKPPPSKKMALPQKIATKLKAFFKSSSLIAKLLPKKKDSSQTSDLRSNSMPSAKPNFLFNGHLGFTNFLDIDLTPWKQVGLDIKYDNHAIELQFEERYNLTDASATYRLIHQDIAPFTIQFETGISLEKQFLPSFLLRTKVLVKEPGKVWWSRASYYDYPSLSLTHLEIGTDLYLHPDFWVRLGIGRSLSSAFNETTFQAMATGRLSFMRLRFGWSRYSEYEVGKLDTIDAYYAGLFVPVTKALEGTLFWTREERQQFISRTYLSFGLNQKF
jgi:hypothetical protein